METTFASLEALQTEAARFVHSLEPSNNKALLVTLSGELGAGKTSFTQGVAKALGITDPITSPTFVLEKRYPLSGIQGFKELVHIDAYRLDGGKDLKPLRFSETLEEPNTLIILEWPEKVEDGLPIPDVAITLSVLKDNTRSITYAQ